MKRKDLKQTKLELNTLRKAYQQKLNKMEELLKVPEVLEYNKLTKEKEMIENKIINKRNSYHRKLQEACEHPAWFLLNERVDGYEQKRYWKCKCLSCEYITEKRSKDYNEKIVIKNNPLGTNKVIERSYDYVYGRYHELKEEKNLSDEDICQKFNNIYKEVWANQYRKK